MNLSQILLRKTKRDKKRHCNKNFTSMFVYRYMSLHWTCLNNVRILVLSVSVASPVDDSLLEMRRESEMVRVSESGNE